MCSVTQVGRLERAFAVRLSRFPVKPSRIPAGLAGLGWAGSCGVQISAMDAARQSVPECERSPGTLGEVLYADRSKTLVPEAEWVALVQSVAAGDQGALYALYERAHRVVFTLSMRITANRETAEEVTLDVFHDVWRRASGYREAHGTVLGWIMNQARSRAIDRLRFEQRKKRVPPEPGNQVPPTASAHPEDLIAIQQQSQAVRRALDVLTADERHAIEAAFFSELTYATVAEQSNQPLGTIKTRIRSGLHKLREALAEAGHRL
jgi:RNA polymerase sigma-70 factor, ECF subfamily